MEEPKDRQVWSACLVDTTKHTRSLSLALTQLAGVEHVAQMLTAGTDSVSESEMARVCVRAERERVFECVQPLLSLDLLSEQTHNRTNVRRVYRAKANVEGSSPVSLLSVTRLMAVLKILVWGHSHLSF